MNYWPIILNGYLAIYFYSRFFFFLLFFKLSLCCVFKMHWKLSGVNSVEPHLMLVSVTEIKAYSGDFCLKLSYRILRKVSCWSPTQPTFLPALGLMLFLIWAPEEASGFHLAAMLNTKWVSFNNRISKVRDHTTESRQSLGDPLWGRFTSHIPCPQKPWWRALWGAFDFLSLSSLCSHVEFVNVKCIKGGAAS